MVINREMKFVLRRARVIADYTCDEQRAAALSRVPSVYKELVEKTVAAIRSSVKTA